MGYDDVAFPPKDERPRTWLHRCWLPSLVFDKLILLCTTGRYIKRLLGEEDGERFGRKSKWGRGRGRGRGRGHHRGGFRQANCRQDGFWRKGRGGGKYSEREARGSDATDDQGRQTEAESIELSPESQVDEKQLSNIGEVHSAENEMDFSKGIMNAIVVDVANVEAAAAASSSRRCDQQEDAGEQAAASHQDLESVCCEGKQQAQCSAGAAAQCSAGAAAGGSGCGAQGRKRKQPEGGRSRRGVKRKRKEVNCTHIVRCSF